MIPRELFPSSRSFGGDAATPTILQKQPTASVFFVPEPDIERFSPHMRHLLITTILLVCCLGAWLLLGQVEIRAVTAGRVLPGIGTQEIMVREEGMVLDKFLVAEGEAVKEGQALAILRKPSWESRAQELYREDAMLVPEIIRLEAELRNTQPEFWTEGLNPAVVQRQRELYEDRKQELAQKLERAEELVRQRGAQIGSINSRLNRAESFLKHVETPPSVIVNLPGDPNSPEEIERSNALKRQTAQNEIATLRRDLNATREELVRAQNLLKSIPADWQRQIEEDLVSRYRQRDAIRSEIRSVNDAAERLVLRAKVDGIVRDQAPLGQDQPIAPFEPLMQVMPTAEGITVVAPISEAQAKSLKANQPAMIQLRISKVNATARLTGSVQQVNKWPVNNNGQFRHEAVIVASGNAALTDRGQTVRLLPGTSVDVNIGMGTESLWQHLRNKTLQTNIAREVRALVSG